jgi:peptidoglycan-associated lipoprotein
MKRLSTPLVMLAFVAAAILPLAQGCKKKPPTTTEEARPPVEQPAPPETRVPPPPAPPAAMPEESIETTPLDVLNTKGYLKDAYFDYDQSDLRDDARSALSGNAEWLKRFPSIQVLIEGHCDERGSEEYNLALGERRAASVKQYLQTLGVSAARMDTVSFGESKPGVQGHDESAWKWNRRGEFKVIKR